MYPKTFTQFETGMLVFTAVLLTSSVWIILAPTIEITQPNAEECLKLITSKLK